MLACSSCLGKTPTPEENGGGKSDGLVHIIKDGKSDYKIIYKNTDELDFFDDYAQKLYGKCIVEYEVRLDKQEADKSESEQELLFGDTGRALSGELKAAVDKAPASEGDFAWGYACKDGKLAFYANSEIGAMLGFEEFTALCFKIGGMSVQEELFTVRTKSRAEYEAEEQKKNEIPKGEPIELTVNADSALADLCPDIAKGICGSIKADTQDKVLTLPSKLIMNGDLEIADITLLGDCTIIANGYTLKIAESVLMPRDFGRLTVFGGTDSRPLEGDTNLILLGARYKDIFGGGNGYIVKGSTYITLGGIANYGEDIDDGNAATFTACKVYGGSDRAEVTGSTNITLTGSAVAKFIIGTGTQAQGAKVKSTNITVEGGKVMNIIGGSENSAAVNITTNITQRAGLIEAIFGGCQSAPMTGNVNITLLGGDVSRRVYAGCYNDGTSHTVTGTLTLTVGPEANLASGKELSWMNGFDRGIFLYSRGGASSADEVGRVIYLDDCYEAQSQKITRSAAKPILCEIAASVNGSVYTDTDGNLIIMPDAGYECNVNGNNYLHSDNESANVLDISAIEPQTKIDVIFVPLR